eukprot:3698311-Rhodomonas_salina.2
MAAFVARHGTPPSEKEADRFDRLDFFRDAIVAGLLALFGVEGEGKQLDAADLEDPPTSNGSYLPRINNHNKKSFLIPM